MTIATYSDLQTAMTSWLGNSLNSANYADFIALFEAVANRRLKTRWQETSATITMSNGQGSLPSDFLQVRRLTWMGSTKVELEYVEPSWIQAAYATNGQGSPRVYTIEGSTITVRPSDDTSLTLVYYASIPALATNSTNWLLTSHPDLYLFGALVESCAFAVDDRMAMWKSRRDELFEEVAALSNKSRVQPAASIRIMTATP